MRTNIPGSGSLFATSRFIRASVLCVCLIAVPPLAAEDYLRPDPDIVETLTAMRPPATLLHPASGQVAFLYTEATVPMARISRAFLGLAGFRFDPLTRTSGIDPLVRRIIIVNTRANDPVRAKLEWLPQADAGFAHVQFSPDGRYLAAIMISAQPAQLVVFDTLTGQADVLAAPINPAWGAPCEWLRVDELLCRLVSAQPEPAKPAYLSPTIISHGTGVAPVRTYSNLLENDAEVLEFEYYFASTMARVSVTGTVTELDKFGGMLAQVNPSPDGNYAVVKRIHKPYSHLVRASNFPSTVEVWDLVNQKALYISGMSGYDLPASDGDDGAVRRFAWKPGTPTALGWVQKETGEDGKSIYRWMSKDASDAAPIEIAQTDRPIDEFAWTTAGTPYFTVKTADKTRVDIFVVAHGAAELLTTLVTGDKYGNPGRAIRVNGDRGAVLERDGQIYLAGDGLGDAGPRPFLDRFDVRTHAVARIFTAQDGVFETVLALLDDHGEALLTSRETETSPPTVYLRKAGTAAALLDPGDPYPELQRLERRVIAYERDDGLALRGTLYRLREAAATPAPTLIWIYPYEYSDPAQAAQLDVRWFRYHRIAGPSPITLALAGYTVLVNPTMPIVQEGDEQNDNYLTQLNASAAAAVDYLVANGISEAGRIAVGGRSYGAFSSANLLIHSDRFATAIVASGAYNRTLTPFGFQREKRSFWEAANYYGSISPFFHVDELHKPILIMHGGADENPGTPTFQSQRFFHALVGQGVTARYVELPYEGHHYLGTENVLHTVKEMIDWLDATIGDKRAADGTARLPDDTAQ